MTLAVPDTNATTLASASAHKKMAALAVSDTADLVTSSSLAPYLRIGTRNYEPGEPFFPGER